MIKTNNSFGIMAMHYAKEKDKPKSEVTPLIERQWTLEEMIKYQAMEPEKKQKNLKTTAWQHPVEPPKRKPGIWEERGE